MAEQLMIDTLGMADKLESSGFARSQAEGLARTLGEELSDRLVSQPQFSMTVTDLRGEIGTLTAEIRQFRTRIKELETRIEALETRIEALETRIEALDTRIEALEARIGALEARIEALEARMDRLEARMDRLEAKLEGEFKAIHTKFWFLYSALGLLLALGLLETFS